LTIQVILHVRPQDPTGEEIRRHLEALRAEFPHALTVITAEQDVPNPSLPYLEVDGRPLKAPLTLPEIKSALAIAGAVAAYKEETRVPTPVRKLAEAADGFAAWFSRHWLASFNSLVFLYLAISFLAPVLMKLGATAPAGWIYTFYSFACHQLGFRSYFLFGPQAAYPRDVFLQFTGIDPDNIFLSRTLVGNELLGYKVALCERDVAIYGSIVLAGILFHFLRGKIKPLSFIGWMIIGIIPIGLDGGTQLLSYLPWHLFPVRESTPFLRTLTGVLFGVTGVWFSYPYVQESMDSDLASHPSPKKP
jgi:uncharacterized membrane protein